MLRLYIKYFYPFTVLLIFIAGACDEGVDYSSGDMMGYVDAYEQAANPVDQSGIMVSLSGRDPVNNSFSLQTAHTDERGKFLISNLERGTYNLILDKEGFGKSIYYGIRHLGGEPTIIGCPQEGSCYSGERLVIYKLPAATISSFDVSSDGIFTIGGTVSPPDTNTYLRLIICIGDDETVNNTNYDHQELSGIQTGTATFNATGCLDSLSRGLYDYDPGTVIYLKAYIGSQYENNTLDYYDGRNYYFCVSRDASETIIILYE